MNIRMRQGRRLTLIWAIIPILVACQPSADERLSRAERFYEESEYRAAIIELKNSLSTNPDSDAARLLLARSSFQIADFATAESEYTRALELGSNDPAAWIGLGRSLLMMGDPSRAFESVAPNLDGDNEIASVLLGDILASLGNISSARSHYEKAQSLNSSSVGALVGLAAIASGEGNQGAARRLIEMVVEKNPNSNSAWLAKGNYLRIRRDFEGASQAYQSSIDNEINSTPIHERFNCRINLATVLLDSGQHDMAKTVTDSLRRDFPPHPLLRFMNGRLAYASGDYPLAQSELQHYLSKAPGDLRGSALMGAINFSQNHLRQAEMYLSQAARSNVGGETTRRLLAETQLRLNKPEDALVALRQAESDGANDPMLMAMLGRAEAGVGNEDAARRYFEIGAETQSDDPAINFAIAAGLLASGGQRRAVEFLESLPSVDDGRYRRETLLMLAHIRDGNPEGARMESARLLSTHPADPTAFSVAAGIAQALDDAAAATANYQKALEIDKNNVAALYGLARQAYAAANYDETSTLLERLLDNTVDFLPALGLLAEVAGRTDSLEQIMHRFAAAVEKSPNAVPLKVLYARAQLADGQPLEASDIAAAALQDNPSHLGLLHVEGLALLQLGQAESALNNLEKAAADEPKNARYQYDLAVAQLNNSDTYGSLESIKRFRDLLPGDARGLALQVQAELANDTPERASAAVREFALARPGQVIVPILNGDIELARSDADAAAKQYERAAALNWSRPVAIRLALAYQASGSPKGTEPLQRWMEENPGDSGVRLMYGQILQSQGSTDTAVRQYEEILKLNQDNPVALNNLAWEYAKAGKPGAVELAERAHQLLPNNSSVMDTLGWILYLQDDLRQSLPYLQKAAELTPDNGEIQYHLATVLAGLGNSKEAKEIVDSLIESDRTFPSRKEAEALARSL